MDNIPMGNIFARLGIKSYFLTGSRALDTFPNEFSSVASDYDYVISITNRHTLLGYLGANFIEVQNSCYNGGFKFVIEGNVINIITACDIEYNAWSEALTILKLLIKTSNVYKKILKNKMSRYCLYEMLRAFVKTAYQLGNSDSVLVESPKEVKYVEDI